MADPITQPVPDSPHSGHGIVDPASVEAGYEESDVDIRGILWFAAGLAGLAVVVHLALAWMLFAWKNEEDRTNQTQFPLAAEEPPPQGPRIEGIENRSGGPKSAPGVSQPLESEAVDAMFTQFLKDPPKARKDKRWGEVSQPQPSDASSGRFPRGGSR